MRKSLILLLNLAFVCWFLCYSYRYSVLFSLFNCCPYSSYVSCINATHMRFWMLSSSTHSSYMFTLKMDAAIFTGMQYSWTTSATMVSGILYHRNSHMLIEYVFVCHFLSPSEVLFSPQVTFFSDYADEFARNTVQILFEGIM